MNNNLQLSGERFRISYILRGNYEEISKKAKNICYEQTVEFPEDLVPIGIIKDQIVGRIEDLIEIEKGKYEVIISYAVETSGFELTQLFNVIYGNTSIKPGIKVDKIVLPDILLNRFKGPQFGRKGIRKLLEVFDRPLLCTALKPMGLSTDKLAKQAYEFAKGGIDIIKDDHGIADQIFSPFEERVQKCCEAVARANQETGYKSFYVPNMNGPTEKIKKKAFFVKEVGAGGLVISPGLTGWDIIRQLAEDNTLSLPILSHPAFLGSFVTSQDNGMSHGVLFGQIMRLIGADAIIFPNYGGRFSFSQEECISIAKMTKAPMGHMASIFPAPGGGMTMNKLPDMFEVYGKDVIFLIGGDLHRHSKDLVKNSQYFRKIVEKM